MMAVPVAARRAVSGYPDVVSALAGFRAVVPVGLLLLFLFLLSRTGGKSLNFLLIC